MHVHILAVYNGYLQRQAGDPLSPRYYHSALCHDSFKELDFKDIKQYFKAAEKISCITPEMKSYFPQTAKGKQRVRHIFSTFLLGIYCYDNINNLQDSIKNFIQQLKTIFPKLTSKTPCIRVTLILTTIFLCTIHH